MTLQNVVGLKIRIRGIVQGVGFRPFVYGAAVDHQLTGWVRNTSSGVEIEVNGDSTNVDRFLDHLKSSPPPLARIDSFEYEPCHPNAYTQFEIYHSEPKPGDFLPISPDMSICPDCQRELFDPKDRRYRYPFINCTNCGPRFTIIQDIPYDRPKTTMSGFPMCPECQAEYVDPLDRRFHAQPVACPTCGPGVWFEDHLHNRLEDGEAALQMARRYLSEGKILAVKGLGGFHLVCDAQNSGAVDELRRRKQRTDKPFALMAFNREIVAKYCQVIPEEASLLESRQRPIVLLEKRPGVDIAAEVAPYQKHLGVMLPYTPLHLLLLEPAPGYPEMFVMTSGNLSEEPIAYQDEDARRRLTPLADGFLLHNRPIHMRVDDSVVRVHQGKLYPVRRARGYAPDAILLHREVPEILATGGELKNAFCLTRSSYAFLSHHIGDLENFETLNSFEQGIAHYERLFRIKPKLIGCDLHPDYLATRYAHQRAEEENLPLVQIQHHHAHLAACLADNGWDRTDPVIGLSFDGTGYGTDGAIWGGEFLLGGYEGYRRLYHLKYAPLPGGDQAVRKPARMALAQLWNAKIDWDPDLPPVSVLCASERSILKSQLDLKLNTPLTSSMGRLFDAAAALIGIRGAVNYEGQAAIEMEACADPDETGAYPLELHQDEIDPAPLWMAMIVDIQSGAGRPQMASRFHNTIANLCLDLCQKIQQDFGSDVVAFSGGVWQNQYLLRATSKRLEQAGFHLLIHRQVPANDGGIALGQALIASSFSHGNG